MSVLIFSFFPSSTLPKCTASVFVTPLQESYRPNKTPFSYVSFCSFFLYHYFLPSSTLLLSTLFFFLNLLIYLFAPPFRSRSPDNGTGSVCPSWFSK